MITPASTQNTSLTERYNQLLQRLTQACEGAARADTVTLLAVSKGHPASAIAALAAQGQRAFGENYLQPALEKMQQLATEQPQLTLEWHYIGGLQSNKTKAVAEHFDWVQSVDRLKIAQRLSEQRPAHLAPLQVLIQVNIDAEAQKSGIAAEETLALARAILGLPNLRLRGLMGLPRAQQDETGTRRSFDHLAALFQQVQKIAPEADTLSMGMSDDLEWAVQAGSTMVRIGTALFGPRTQQPGETASPV